MPTPAPVLSPDAEEVLCLLRDRHNVLLSGAPATGKSRLLAEIKRAFEWTPSAPGYLPTKPIAIPATAPAGSLAWVPSPHRTDRKPFATVFDQSTKLRDFLRGLEPEVDPTATTMKFRVSSGILYRASQHARTSDGASLLIIDEINRGPAVAIFGPSIVAIESDKRLDDAGNRTLQTASFILPDDLGNQIDYELPTHLYILACMNQADTSVEPLDVAFLRRFAPFELSPSPAPALHHFGLSASPSSHPATPSSSADVYGVLVPAWERVNSSLALGRGDAFQVGHGVLMQSAPPSGLPEALAYAGAAWAVIRAHIDEVFFGDVRAAGETLGAGRPGSPYTVVDRIFAGQPVVQLTGPRHPHGSDLYAALKSIVEA